MLGQETARWHRFTIALNDLAKPEGSQTVFGLGSSIVENLNGGIRLMRDTDEWLWVVGDDHTFEPDTLMRLLEVDADIVAPLCARRHPPFGLVHYERQILDTEFMRPVQYDEIQDEPFEVFSTGSLMLIRRHVLDAIGDPWFQTAPAMQNEDVAFCHRVRELGFSIVVDPTTVIGHIGQVIVYPQKRAGVWGLMLDFPGIGRNQVFYPGGIAEGGLGTLEPKRALAHA